MTTAAAAQMKTGPIKKRMRSPYSISTIRNWVGLLSKTCSPELRERKMWGVSKAATRRAKRTAAAIYFCTLVLTCG